MKYTFVKTAVYGLAVLLLAFYLWPSAEDSQQEVVLIQENDGNSIKPEKKISSDSFKKYLEKQYVEDSADETQDEKTMGISKTQSLKSRKGFQTKVVSLKQAHLDFLRQRKATEEREFTAENGQEVKLTLVEANNFLGTHFIIQDQLDPQRNVKQSYTYVADHILVRFFDSQDSKSIKEFEEEYQLQNAKKLLLPRTYRFDLKEINLSNHVNLLSSLKENNEVEYSSGNSVSYSSIIPNDTLYEALWGLNNNGTDPVENNAFVSDMDIQADNAWDDLTDCSKTAVAVLDTGVDPGHPDLKGNILEGEGRDFTSGNMNDFMDRQSHGTHVSGTIGAVGNNNLGITGVCWKAKIIPIKVLGDNGTGSLEMIVNGLTYASMSQAKILNLSLGGAPPTQLEIDAIAANTMNGKLLVVAAGNEDNDNDQNPAYPASYEDPGIISVAAIHGGGDLAQFSNYGLNSVDIAAPGQDIVSTVPRALVQNPNNAYSAFSGTSMAAPHVTGAVALFWSFAPELTAQEVRSELFNSAITGTFTKDVNQSRLMDLDNLMDTVKAKASIQQVAETLSASRGTQFVLNLSTEVTYSDIQKIEIMHMGDVIGVATGGNVSSVTIQVPLGFAQADVYARVTDIRGRTFDSAVIPLNIDLNKVIGFQEVDKLSLTGSAGCQVLRVTSVGEEILYETQVETKRKCQKFCDVVGPLLYSSLGEIKCSQDGVTIYSVRQGG